MERGFLFIVLDSRDELWQQSLRCDSSLIKEPSFIFAGARRGDARDRRGQARARLVFTKSFSRSAPAIRAAPPGLVIGQNSGLISIFNLGRQTIKTSRNKPNMSKVKRQVGPRSRLAAASCKEAQIGLVGLQCAGGLGGFR